MKNDFENIMWLFDMKIGQQTFIHSESNEKFYLSVYPNTSNIGKGQNLSEYTYSYQIHKVPQSVYLSVGIGYRGDDSYLSFLEFTEEKNFTDFLKVFHDNPKAFIPKPFVMV